MTIPVQIDQEDHMPLSPTMKERVRTLRDHGATLHAIATELGVPPKAIAPYFSYGRSPKPTGEASAPVVPPVPPTRATAPLRLLTAAERDVAAGLASEGMSARRIAETIGDHTEAEVLMALGPVPFLGQPKRETVRTVEASTDSKDLHVASKGTSDELIPRAKEIASALDRALHRDPPDVTPLVAEDAESTDDLTPTNGARVDSPPAIPLAGDLPEPAAPDVAASEPSTIEAPDPLAPPAVESSTPTEVWPSVGAWQRGAIRLCQRRLGAKGLVRCQHPQGSHASGPGEWGTGCTVNGCGCGAWQPEPGVATGADHAFFIPPAIPEPPAPAPDPVGQHPSVLWTVPDDDGTVDSTEPVELHPWIGGALQWLAENGRGWTAAQYEAWGNGLDIAIRLVYPVQP